MRVLITRPRRDSEALAETLAARGIAAAVDPMLEIRDRGGAPLDLAGVAGLLVTSANGVRALAARTARRDIPVFAVGDATAAEARAAGFERVASAGGTVEDLARLVRERLRPEAGPLIHAAGAAVKGDLARMLGEAGHAVRRIVLYEAVPARRLAAETVAALRGGGLDGVLFFSPRTAETFASLVRAAGLEDACRPVDAYCLSDAVAVSVDALPWRAVHVAERPDQTALLALLEQWRSRRKAGE